jgi:phosphomevalonate kinase
VLVRGSPAHDHAGVWDAVVEPFSLPPPLELIMGDVCGGSSTPSMVRKVLQWRETDKYVAGQGSNTSWLR